MSVDDDFGALLLSQTAQAAGTATGKAVRVPSGGFLQLTLAVTAAAAGAGDSLDARMEGSFDGGTTWYVLSRFGAKLGSGGAVADTVQIGNLFTATVTAGIGTAPAANTHRQVRAPLVRAVGIVAGGTAAFTYTLRLHRF